MDQTPWWQRPLAELDEQQWEQLCDGCGKCCMAKLEDPEIKTIYFSNVACELFDSTRCRCGDYAQRDQVVSNCRRLSLDRPEEFAWLPSSCAYRLRLHDQALPEWHHLLTGSKDTVHELGLSMQGKAIAAEEAGPVEHHIIDMTSE